MNRELGLKILAQIMNWSGEQAQEEFRWLSFMSVYKYDGYREYLAGARFIESLATWLQQFQFDDREVAYRYIKENLIYIGPAEMQRLVEKFFPETVQKNLKTKVAENLSIPGYMVWSSEESLDNFHSEVRKTLFMGLSDGARLDSLRRANAGIISNEQVAITTEISNAKWEDLLHELKGDSKNKDGSQQFTRVYLIDDFTASGTSLIREDPIGSGKFKGKLKKFVHALLQATTYLNGSSPFVDKFQIIVHHYIGTHQAQKNIEEQYSQAKKELEKAGIYDVQFSFGMLLPSNIRLTAFSSEPFASLCKNYYDHSIYDKHFKKSGCPDGMFGYAECGLPVILDHNTPNNSLSLLWAETKGTNGSHPMRPLFRRRQRHMELTG